MKNSISEYDQIRNMLGKIRLIKEDVTPNQMQQSGMQQQGMQQAKTPSGEKISFDDINTVGFISGDVRDEIKNSIKMAVGSFIKATGLLMDTVNIMVEDDKITIVSDTLKNSAMTTIKSVTFDTDQESPYFEVVNGKIDITEDFSNLVQTISRTFNDPQIGKTALITSTQGNV
jgi:hypothetical protein